MKGGDVVLLYALKALHAAGALEDAAFIDPHATKQWVDKIKKSKDR